MGGRGLNGNGNSWEHLHCDIFFRVCEVVVTEFLDGMCRVINLKSLYGNEKVSEHGARTESGKPEKDLVSFI